MSERSYFSYRWAIPGFTFILIIISLNHQVLIQSLEQEQGIPAFLQIFFGLITILSGSGIGFLISQIWHCFHQFFCLFYGAPRKPYQTTIDLYKLEKGDEKKNDKERIRSFFVYLLNSYSDQQEQLTKLLSRRGDLYHLFGSEITSLLMAIVLGWKIRIISSCLLGKDYTYVETVWWRTTEGWILVVTTIFSIIFMVLLYFRLHSVNKEYNVYADFYIKSIFNEDDKKKMYELLSHEYFYWSLDEINIPYKYEEILKKICIDSVYKLAKYKLTKDHKKIIPNQISKEELKKWMCKANKFLDDTRSSALLDIE